MYTLDQVRCFVAVAEHLHFGKAAEALSMTQPPLSRQIQKLERFVGVDLLERDNKRVTLTAAGEAFLDNAQVLLAMADRAPQDARRIASGQWGRLSIGFTAASGFGILGSLVTAIEENFPGIDLDLYEMVTGEQLENLAEGRIDLGLGRSDTTPSFINSELLLAERLLLAIPDGHRLMDLERPLRKDEGDVLLRPHHSSLPDRPSHGEAFDQSGADDDQPRRRQPRAGLRPGIGIARQCARSALPTL
jgi:DNA-binding transcriptional LysR family regulator